MFLMMTILQGNKLSRGKQDPRDEYNCTVPSRTQKSTRIMPQVRCTASLNLHLSISCRLTSLTEKKISQSS